MAKVPGFMKKLAQVKPSLPTGQGIGKPHLPVAKKKKAKAKKADA